MPAPSPKKITRNLLPLTGFLLCVLAFLSYPLFFVQFPLTRDVPWANWALFVLGLVLTGVGVARPFRQPERYRGRITSPIVGVFSLAAFGLFLFMTEVASRWLPESGDAPQVGEQAPDFSLPDVHGRTVRLSELLENDGPEDGAPGSWVLLVFYRGHW